MDKGKRFPEVDLLRGAAVIGMVLYHLLFDLDYLGLWQVGARSGPLLLLARLVAGTFLLVVGASLFLSAERCGKRPSFAKYLWRGIKIFALGMLISAATWIYSPEEMVRFGVLHLIGVSIVISYPFLERPRMGFLAGAAAVACGLSLGRLDLPAGPLLWLYPERFNTLDYFPILPWFGIVLIGLALSSLAYGGYRRRFTLPWTEDLPAAVALSTVGRHSLLIYLLHQPVIFVALELAATVGLLPQPR
ncbi:MAG: DUF1624 domain-containing protein [Methanotrichaceae archaeon]|nr:DUF1624 domain-containing protein [Methanotrichaceae archaeon]